MALNATLYNFEINLSDTDRGVYRTLSFKVAQHPSETAEYLCTRALAYCLEYREGLSFSKVHRADKIEIYTFDRALCWLTKRDSPRMARTRPLTVT